MEAWAKSAREDLDRSGSTSQGKESRCGKRTVAGWGLRAQRQTKSVWHSVRTGPIARILHGGEKAPGPIGGLFRRLIKTGERRGVEGRGIIKTIRNWIARAVGDAKG